LRDARPDCLSTETLQTLANGVLPEGQHAHVRAHLSECSRCLGRLAEAVMNRRPVAPADPWETAPPQQNQWPPRSVRWASVLIAGFTLAVCVMWGFDVLGARPHIQHTLSRGVVLANAGLQAIERLEITSRASAAIETLTRERREPLPPTEPAPSATARPALSGEAP
jgi:hypothetical protein